MSELIRLILADHNTLFRRCLASALNRRRDFDVVGNAASGRETLDLARSLRPDVVIVEPSLPDGGPDVIRSLCSILPDAGVLLLSSCCDEAIREALLVGARGYVAMTCEPEDLVRAIKRVHAGELVVGPQAIGSILEHLNGNVPHAAQSGGALTPREMDVLRLVAAGRTNPEIARELYITEHTAKGHLAKILGKLGVDNRVQLATYAIQHGLVDASAETDGRAP